MAVLGVTRAANQEEVDKAWRSKLKACHPDLARGLNEASRAALKIKAQEANEARKILIASLRSAKRTASPKIAKPSSEEQELFARWYEEHLKKKAQDEVKSKAQQEEVRENAEKSRTKKSGESKRKEQSRFREEVLRKEAGERALERE